MLFRVLQYHKNYHFDIKQETIACWLRTAVSIFHANMYASLTVVMGEKVCDYGIHYNQMRGKNRWRTSWREQHTESLLNLSVLFSLRWNIKSQIFFFDPTINKNVYDCEQIEIIELNCVVVLVSIATSSFSNLWFGCLIFDGLIIFTSRPRSFRTLPLANVKKILGASTPSFVSLSSFSFSFSNIKTNPPSSKML